MHLVQLFLPLYDNEGHRFPRAAIDSVRTELTGRFGGVTAFLRSPAIGLWQDDEGGVRRDDIVIFEVMIDHLDRPWWHEYRRQLERRFRQDEIILRSHRVTRL